MLKRKGKRARSHRHWCTECRGSQVCMEECGPRRKTRPGEPVVLDDLFEVCLRCKRLKEALRCFDPSTMTLLILRSPGRGLSPINEICWN